jgi:branched-chain amino acid transport system substrate-binding protein
MDRFAKEQGIKVATSENFLNYSAMRILAAAMEKAGTVTDHAKIKAAFSEVLPLPSEINPIPYAGIQENRLLVQATIQWIENGQYSQPIQHIWWLKDEAEYKRVIEQLPDTGAAQKLLPLEGYAK